MWREVKCELGVCRVWMKRDEWMGKCILPDGFVTPNMPKLRYALEFASVPRFRVFRKLRRELESFDEMWVFEKRDGFNLLFYQWRGRVIPKTRLLPVAGGKTRRVIESPRFPLSEVEEMVRDGFTPVFEVWGSEVEKEGVKAGRVNKRVAEELEGLEGFNVDLIGVQVEERGGWRWLHPEKSIQLAGEYGLGHVKLHGVEEVSVEAVWRLMWEAERRNVEAGDVVTEGFVAHCYSGELKMFKVKAFSVMRDDVSKTRLSRERVKLEVEKVLLESPIEDVARNPEGYLKQVIQYLEEDVEVSKREKRMVEDVFLEAVAEEVLRVNPDVAGEWMGRRGWHKRVIGAVLKMKRRDNALTQPDTPRTVVKTRPSPSA